MTEIRFPATQTVHWPNKPTNACDEHAQGLHKLAAFMGVHVVSTVLEEPAECDNCVNENKGQDKGDKDNPRSG